MRFVITRPRRLWYLCLVPAITFGLACGEGDPSSGLGPAGAIGASPTPTPAITPVPTVEKEGQVLITAEPGPTHAADDPFVLTISVTPAPPRTPAELVAAFEVIVTGRVVQILPAQWTTPDGQRPSNPWEAGIVPQEYTIITPVVIELDAPPLVNRTASDISVGTRIAIAAMGGQVGPDSLYTNVPWWQYAPDERVLVALTARGIYSDAITTPVVTTAGPTWNVTAKYQITEDDMAVDYAGSQPAVELISAISDAASMNSGTGSG